MEDVKKSLNLKIITDELIKLMKLKDRYLRDLGDTVLRTILRVEFLFKERDSSRSQ